MRAGAALVLVPMLAACHVQLQPAPPGQLQAGGAGRVYEYAHNAFRGPQLSRAQFAALAKSQPQCPAWCSVKHNTLLPGDGGDDDVPPGWELYSHPWAPAGPVSAAQVAAAAADVDRCLAAGRCVYRHCKLGEDRTGLAVASDRMRWSSPLVPASAVAAAAWREALAYGFHDGYANSPGLPWLVASFKHELRAFIGDPGWDVP